MPKKSALRSEPRHIVDNRVDQALSHLKENIENVAPNYQGGGSVDTKNARQTHNLHIQMNEENLKKGGIKSRSRGETPDTEVSRSLALVASNASRILANITNTIETHSKISRHERETRGVYNLNMTEAKHRALTEGSELEDQEKVKNLRNVPTSGWFLQNNVKSNRTTGSLSLEKLSPRNAEITQKNTQNLHILEDWKSDQGYEELAGNEKKKEKVSCGNMYGSLTLCETNWREALTSNNAGRSQGGAKTARDCNSREDRSYFIPFDPRKEKRRATCLVNQTDIIACQQYEEFGVSHSLDIVPDDLLYPKLSDTLHKEKFQDQFSTKYQKYGTLPQPKETMKVDFEKKYLEQKKKNMVLEKEVLDLKKELYELRETVKSQRKEKKDVEILIKIKEDQQLSISKLEREKAEYMQQIADLNSELEGLRKQFQNKLFTFTNVISQLQEEIQTLQIQANQKNIESKFIDKKLHEELPSYRHHDYGIDANICMEHQLSVKDADQSHKSMMKFVDCVTELVIECSPSNAFVGSRPTLKENWKWIKNMVKDYMVIKRKQPELNESDEISRACMDFLLVKEKKGIIPSLHQILVENKRLEQMLSECKMLHRIENQGSCPAVLEERNGVQDKK